MQCSPRSGTKDTRVQGASPMRMWLIRASPADVVSIRWPQPGVRPPTCKRRNQTYILPQRRASRDTIPIQHGRTTNETAPALDAETE